MGVKLRKETQLLAMDPLYFLDRFLVLSHVAAGFTGLVVAPLAMLTVKGGRDHRRWGKIFFWSMFWIFVSTLGIMFFRFNVFLAVIAILSFYSALTGYRALYRKRPERGDKPTWLDWTGSIVGVVSGLGLAGWGALGLAGLVSVGWPSTFFILGLVFGLALCANAVPDLASYLRPAKDQNWWWYFHMERMLGAYTAMVTAFVVQNVGRRLPDEWVWVTWVLPALVAIPLMNLWINHYRRKFGARPAGAAAEAREAAQT
jgi:uncharacterized membrane protein